MGVNNGKQWSNNSGDCVQQLTKVMITKNGTINFTLCKNRNHLLTFGKGTHCKTNKKYILNKEQNKL
jgi:hypothetical protein